MEEQKMILKMVEDGKITAEEGYALLVALDKTDSNSLSRSLEYINNQQTQHYQPTLHSPPEPPHPHPKTFSHHAEFRGDGNSEQFQHVKREINEATEKIISSANIGASKLMDFVGKAFHKLQELDIDIDFSMDKGLKVEKEYILEDFEAKKLLLKTTYGSIRLKSWDKDGAKVFVSGHVSAKEENQALEKLNEAIHIMESNEVYQFVLNNVKGVKCNIEMKVPKRIFDAITLTSVSGSISVSEIHTDLLELETENGSIRCNGVHSEQCNSKTINGRIQLHDSEIGTCSAYTSNGNLQLGGQFKTITSETTNGTIQIIQERTLESHITAKTKNGSIRVYYPTHTEGVYGEMKSEFGTVKCSLPNTKIIEEDNQVGRKSMSFEQGNKKWHSVNLSTASGSLHIEEIGSQI